MGATMKNHMRHDIIQWPATGDAAAATDESVLEHLRTEPYLDAFGRAKMGFHSFCGQRYGRPILKSNTETLSQGRDWRRQYYDSLESLEREREKFQALEAVLKRIAGRLCTVSLGQSTQLDEQIKALQLAVRRECSSSELEKIAAALTDAIVKLNDPPPSQGRSPPQSAPAAPAAANIVDDHIRATLSSLLQELRRDRELVVRADALESTLASAVNRDQLGGLIVSISELVTQRIHGIEREKQEIETLLTHMVGRLDEISRFAADHDHHQSQSIISRESFDAQLMGEMKAMSDSVATAIDLEQIRCQVRGRLDSIGQYMKEFRERETQRAEEMRARGEQMRSRVAQLEGEARKLRHQLNDEQRLATIDPLTEIPNRLAYEKRIEDELQRWRRFRQPTTLAIWDIDRFKSINDSYGHRAGDRVLRAVAKVLASRIRSTDFLARIGGEEFVMMLCGTRIEDALGIMNQTRTEISALKFHSSGTPLAPVTISSGVTMLLADDSAGTVFDRADKALYRAKDTGRNRCLSG
jgi:diguanylate cyclase